DSLRHWREPRHVLLLIWFAVGMVPGVLSSEAPRVYRVLLATPPLFVWAALPLARLLAAAALERDRTAGALAALILMAVPVVDFTELFYRVYTHPEYDWMQASRLVEQARVLRAYGPGWTGYIVSPNYDSEHETFRFLRRVWKLDLHDVAGLGDLLPLRSDDNAL